MNCRIGQDIAFAAEQLRAGRLVAFATETVYGLGANALDESAVARVFEVKQRPTFDPLIVHVAEPDQLAELTSGIPGPARRLADRFWPGPLTLVLPKTSRVPDLVTAGLDTVAVRIPEHPTAQQLLRKCAIPVAAPSANPFGAISPTTAEDVAATLGDRIDYILDGGPCTVGVESTVVAVSDDQCVLLRSGGTTIEELESVVGQVALPSASGADADAPLPSPGMLSRHYAPNTPLRIVTPSELVRLLESPDNLKTGLLLPQAIEGTDSAAHVEILSATGDLRESAARFFSALRRLDAANPDQILAVRFPDRDLGRALNDRLTRAAVDRQ